MKYAILNPHKSIPRTFAEYPQRLPEGYSVIEVSDEIAAVIDAGRAAQPPTIYFYEDGKLLSLEEKREQSRKKLMPPVSAEKWIEQQDYSAIRIVALMDTEAKLTAAGKNSAKLAAVRQWLDGITATYALNPVSRNDWPDAPFRFEETMQEAIAALNP